jgi:uncharacterized membrane protein YphA (DoxX/SURF4 family)
MSRAVTAGPGAGLRFRVPGWIEPLALVLLCSAYLQGSLTKLFDFGAAIAEMAGFGLEPAPLFAGLVIALELLSSVMIISGLWRWLGALLLAAFTLAATFMAARFWAVPPPARMPVENAFFEHLGLVGGFLLVAWTDLERRARLASLKGQL